MENNVEKFSGVTRGTFFYIAYPPQKKDPPGGEGRIINQKNFHHNEEHASTAHFGPSGDGPGEKNKPVFKTSGKNQSR